MNNTQHNNSIETLVTERLVLRALEENDAKALLNTIGDRETAWCQNETIKFVTLEILPENLPSLGVARKCGFSLVVEPEEKKHRRFLDDKSLNLYVLNKQ